MKKIFALALAAVMATGMTSVAFAAAIGDDKQLVIGQFDKGTNALITPVYTDATTGGVFADDVSAAETLTPGSKVYIPISFFTDATDAAADTDPLAGTAAADYREPTKEEIKGYKAMISYKVGKLDKAPTVEYVKYQNEALATPKPEYGWAIVVTVNENQTAKGIDIGADIVLGKTTTEQKAANVARTIGFDYAIARGQVDLSTGGNVANKTGVWGTFDDCTDEIDITWNDDAFTFTVNANGQSKLNLRMSTKYNAEIGGMYPAANIDFIKFEAAPTFNRTGMAYVMDDASNKFLYEVTATGVKAVDAKYDEAMGGYAFKTRKLSSYALSDKELDTTKVIETASTSSAATSSKPATEKPNPDTGR